MLNYCEVLRELPPHVQVGHQVMIAYENSPEIASWEDEQAELIFEEVEREKDFFIKPWIDKYSPSRQECIDGVEFWLEIRRLAEEVALDIISRWLGRDDFDIEGLSINQKYVDWALNAESEEDESLWAIRANDPLLYGEAVSNLNRNTQPG